MRPLFLGVSVTVSGWLTTVAVPRQVDPTPEPFVAESGERITILPRPDSGQTPQTPGDPGGSMQLALLALVCIALVVVGVLAWRDARRRRGFPSTDATP